MAVARARTDDREGYSCSAVHFAFKRLLSLPPVPWPANPRADPRKDANRGPAATAPGELRARPGPCPPEEKDGRPYLR